MTTTEFVYVAISFITGCIVIIAKDFLSAFTKEKGKNIAAMDDLEEVTMLKKRGENIATKEDIQDITRLQEDIKADFQLKMEQQKSEISRLSKEFELYVVKKHEYYPELYKNIELCIGKVMGFRGITKGIDFRNVNKEDIEKYMEEKQFTQADKHLVCSDWDTNKEQAIKNLHYRLERINYNEGEEYYAKVHNFYLLHRLYFSDDVSSKAKETLDKIHILWTNYNPDIMLVSGSKLVLELHEENTEIRKNINVLREELFELLQNELKAGSAI
ncbi:hypothetical protein NMG90_06305 [Bacillus mycoides]|uniref:hypothetical protein n=1 Tax=Bacillus TaxID=1386 RepID=UPI0020C94C23|nr:hypothetical protein [Bacillus mycoides]MCP9225103.1 hypothetical protein [Bacillus mycoides]